MTPALPLHLTSSPEPSMRDDTMHCALRTAHYSLLAAHYSPGTSPSASPRQRSPGSRSPPSSSVRHTDRLEPTQIAWLERAGSVVPGRRCY
jgi:hypothetical protein